MICTALRALHRLFIDPEKRRLKKKLEPMVVAVAVDAVAPVLPTISISSTDGFWRGTTSCKKSNSGRLSPSLSLKAPRLAKTRTESSSSP